MSAAILYEETACPVGIAQVRTCYDLFDCVLPQMDVWDLTEGKYEGNPMLSYDVAQANQHAYLLDQVGCLADGRGFRLLDIGCGNGTLLLAAKRRGAQTAGITISPRQAARCHAAGLEKVYLADWQHLVTDWPQRVHGIIANGSLEHFVQPQQAAAGLADGIYQRLFETCAYLLMPGGPRRLVTTTIHFGSMNVPPEDFMRHPLRQPFGSPGFHLAMLHHTLGGYYPTHGQLERCAAPHFLLVAEEDGTQDYCWTSEAWLLRARRAFWHPRRAWKTWTRLLPFFVRYPHHSLLTVLLLFSQSWQWQFRGELPPMRLLRQTWESR